jgi:hypothetical protein
MSNKDFQNGYTLGLATNANIELTKTFQIPMEAANVSTISVFVPEKINSITEKTFNEKGKIMLDISTVSVTINGEPIVGQTLSVSSKIDVSKCSYNWLRYIGLNNYQKYSHTPNLNDAGEKLRNYENSFTKTEVVTIEGAEELNVTIKYGTESVSYDWVCIYEGNHPDYSASTSGYLLKLGGTDGEQTITVNGDSVTFCFKSDGSAVGSGYGYYATVDGMGVTFDTASTDSTYTIREDDQYLYCELTAMKDSDYTGTTKTNIIQIGE